MGLHTRLPNGIDEVDVIIAGGGTAGCVVAARLADADPDLSILVIELGPDNRDAVPIMYPMLCLTNLLPDSKYTIFYQANKAEEVAGRTPVIPAGAVLGGGSSINLMAYSRPRRSDFDAWRAPGWSADDMLPYLKKLETYHGSASKEAHGYDGPIHVSEGTYRATVGTDDFIQAAMQIGIPKVQDLGGLDAGDGAQPAQRLISPDGKRQDAATRYLHPRLGDEKHPNLHVVVESQVVRIIFEGKRAVGVEYMPRAEAGGADGDGIQVPPTRTVRARKLVIISCGACSTPAVLERSGIGAPVVLAEAGVELVADIPGVGQNYTDHNLILPMYKTSLDSSQTLDSVLSGREDPAELIKNNDARLGWNFQDVIVKIRPTDAEAAAIGPEFYEAWVKDYKEKPDKPVGHISPVATYASDPSQVAPGQYISMSAWNTSPYSRGHINISGPSINAPLDFAQGFFTDEHDVDLKTCTWLYKKQREIARRMVHFRGEVAHTHPSFAEGSKAACVESVDVTDLRNDGGSENESNIEYTAEDDAAIEHWVRGTASATWHSLGTCRMGPLEDLGVVDARLGVHGIQGLKIADLSIVPGNISANTGTTAFAIGEKAADIFIKELGLSGGKA